MELAIDDGGSVAVARLSGRLDTDGVGRIELAFTARVVPESRPVLVDLTGLDFIASLGVRLLITTARSRARRGAALVMYGAGEAVTDIITTMGLDEIIPLLPDENAARAAVNG
ncbi:MAG: STAS domain-containing protein [Sphingomonadales bacterium]|jgi:anti-anti-sigma factor